MAIFKPCKDYVWLKGLYGEFNGDNSCISLFSDSQSDILHPSSNMCTFGYVLSQTLLISTNFVEKTPFMTLN
jgi:hypothetical protein